MDFNASRLTLYAILSAIETDLRFAVASNLSGQLAHEQLFGHEAYDKAVQRMSSDNTVLPTQASLEQFLVYVDFYDTIHALNRHKSLLPKSMAGYVKGITPRLEKLVPVRNRIAHSRPLLFDDLPTTADAAKILFVTTRVFGLN